MPCFDPVGISSAGTLPLNIKVPAPGGADRAKQVERIATDVLPLLRDA